MPEERDALQFHTSVFEGVGIESTLPTLEYVPLTLFSKLGPISDTLDGECTPVGDFYEIGTPVNFMGQ
jgi:hypothetical protein